MNTIKKLIVTSAILGTIIPVNNMQAMNDDEVKEEMDHKSPADSALLHAIEDNDIKAAEAALDAGANIEVRGDYGYTPLLLAAVSAETDKSALVKLLLDRGARIDNTSDITEDTFVKNNITALDGVVNTGLLNSLEVLLAHGANTNRKNLLNDTPLTRTVYNLEELTRLGWSARGIEKQKKMARMLIFADADPYLAGKTNKNSLEMASELTQKMILKASQIKEKAFEQLDRLKEALQNTLRQNPHTPVEDVVQQFPNDSIVRCENDDNDQRAYDFLNERIAQRWDTIKKELVISSLLHNHHLPVNDVAAIVMDYLNMAAQPLARMNNPQSPFLASKPSSEPLVISAMAITPSKACKTCTFENKVNARNCEMCNTPFQAEEAAGIVCRQCTFENKADARNCEVCNAPVQAAEAAGITCAQCTFENKAGTPTCAMCNTPLPTEEEIARNQAAAEYQAVRAALPRIPGGPR